MAIPRSLQQHIRERAGGLCEYCHLPDTPTTLPFQIDHIIAEKHAGPTILENLAYCCLHCNAFKSRVGHECPLPSGGSTGSHH